MARPSRKGQRGRTDYDNVVMVLEAEDEEEEDFEKEDDEKLTQSLGVTAICDLIPNVNSKFRGRIHWKKKCFLARDGKTFISRIRVGDDKNHDSFVQISAFGQNAMWIEQNLKEGISYEFEGIKLRNSNRRFNPVSHKVEGLLYTRQSKVTEIGALTEFPDRLYYDLISFGSISNLTSSTCLEIIGVVHTVGPVIDKNGHKLMKVTLVDSSKFKVAFYIWNDDLIEFQWIRGTILLLQGLKIMFSRERVDFSVLRCKHMEINPQLQEPPLQEAVNLKRWWNGGGMNDDFVDFPNFRDRFQLFIDALAYYNNNKDKERLTVTALAKEFGVACRTLNSFFNSNEIRFYKTEKVDESVQRYLNRNEGERVKDVIVEGVTTNAVNSALSIRHLTNKQFHTSYDTDLIEKLREKYKNKEEGETLLSICNYDYNLVAIVSQARGKNNEAKKRKSLPKNPEKALRAALFYNDNKETWSQKDVVDHFNLDDKGELLPANKRITVDAVKNANKRAKKNNPNGWEQDIRKKVRDLNKKYKS